MLLWLEKAALCTVCDAAGGERAGTDSVHRLRGKFACSAIHNIDGYRNRYFWIVAAFRNILTYGAVTIPTTARSAEASSLGERPLRFPLFRDDWRFDVLALDEKLQDSSFYARAYPHRTAREPCLIFPLPSAPMAIGQQGSRRPNSVQGNAIQLYSPVAK